MALTFGSLFAGVDGFGLGFERAGLKCKWQVEINEFCRQVLSKHWPVPEVHGHSELEPVDVVIGGDPCQRNSAAGNSGDESLGGEFVRIVDALRPRVVVRENPSHIRKDAPWPWWRMRSAFESLGYAVLPFRLRACCFGAFHQRERVFLLAELADANRNGLEGWEEETEARHTVQPARRVHAGDWLAVSASRGLRGRRGFPNYVDRIRGIGNSVYPAVAQWIGERIVAGLTARQVAGGNGEG